MNTLGVFLICWLAGEGSGESPAQLYERSVRKTIDQIALEVERRTNIWQDHSTWDRAWQVQTTHYAVRATHSRFLANDLAQGLELMLGHFQTVLGTQYAPPAPLPILVLPSLAEYNQFASQAGDHSSFYGSYYAAEDTSRPVVTYYTGNTTLLRMWITHSATHQYLDLAFHQPGTPAWIEEGLAAYFALYWDYRFGVRELERLKQANKLLPLRGLLGAPAPRYADNPDARFLELAMFFTYMLQFREDTKTDENNGVISAPFAEYLRLRLTGQNAADHPVEKLLRDDLGDVDEEFRDFEFPP